MEMVVLYVSGRVDARFIKLISLFERKNLTTKQLNADMIKHLPRLRIPSFGLSRAWLQCAKYLL